MDRIGNTAEKSSKVLKHRSNVSAVEDHIDILKYASKNSGYSTTVIKKKLKPLWQPPVWLAGQNNLHMENLELGK